MIVTASKDALPTSRDGTVRERRDHVGGYAVPKPSLFGTSTRGLTYDVHITSRSSSYGAVHLNATTFVQAVAPRASHILVVPESV